MNKDAVEIKCDICNQLIGYELFDKNELEDRTKKHLCLKCGEEELINIGELQKELLEGINKLRGIFDEGEEDE